MFSVCFALFWGFCARMAGLCFGFVGFVVFRVVSWVLWVMLLGVVWFVLVLWNFLCWFSGFV